MEKLKEFVFGSLNNKKLLEVQSLCGNYNVTVKNATSFINQMPEETGRTFAENAEIKAKYLGNICKAPILADDSGFCVEALNGDPGVYSARWAEGYKDYSLAISKIYNRMQNQTNYNASFICVLCLFLPESNTIEYFNGEIKGKLSFSNINKSGFAYDVIFIPNGHNKTFAEMLPEEKNLMSHRGLAFNLFAKKWLQKN